MIYEEAFMDVTATAYYPAGDDSWTAYEMQNYGGTITREPSGEAGNDLQITRQPESFEGLVGETATFAVEANREDVTWQWYFSSDSGATWQKSNCTDASYALEFRAYRLGYLYRCEVTDSEGNTAVSDTAALLAREAELAVTTQPVSYFGAVNDSVSFTVEATGNGVTYEWFYSTDGGSTWILTYLDGSMTQTLHFAVTAARGAKLYKCVITDIGGSTVETDAVSVTVG